ncbi:MAG: type III pantothenate kinase [Elusimicrobia bacterium]|nr:type III pantothenate kinase [Elusimicrobiota bacterium]
MLLAADVGNTNVTIGAFQGERLLNLWRLGTDPKKTADEYGAALRAILSSNGGESDRVDAVIYGSVVPALNPALEGAARRYFGVEAIAVTPDSRLGLALKVEQPAEVGADRLLNVLAAARLVGAPCVVIDFGTATTFDCVSAKGEYLGGSILIGPKVAAAALARYTAKLPEVDIVKPPCAIGKSTVSCIQVGLYTGYIGMLDRVLAETLGELRRGGRSRPRVVATGGLAGLFLKDLKGVDRHMPELTLQGLRLAYEILGSRKERSLGGKRAK